MSKKTLQHISIWVIAIVITIGAVFFQRMTGPTNPKSVSFTLNGKEYKTRLPRSLVIPKEAAQHGEQRKGHPSGLIFKIADFPENAFITVYAKRFRTNDEWSFITTGRRENVFIAALPVQPIAGKLSYYLTISYKGKSIDPFKDEPLVIRYRGDVPAWIMVPHIFFVFLAMLFSTLAGIFALYKRENFIRYAKLTLATLFVGGLILGPIMQKFAFDVFWAGWPFGSDLTDNKTLVVFVFWLIVALINRTKRRYIWGIIAAIFMLLIYSIPHSTMGSEYDHKTGKVITAPRE
ncbi:MAG: hypothetical protein LBG19_05085 [Prevotellaceae bacterium]|jgi:hypothetical protein|nr:hypothetical protein [Prevotellaceae bacterium]